MGGKRRDFVLITIWWVNFNCRAPRSSQVISVMRVMMDLDETFQQLYILLKVHVPVCISVFWPFWWGRIAWKTGASWASEFSLQLQNLKPILRFTQLMRKCPYAHLQSILQSFANVDSNCSYCWAPVGTVVGGLMGVTNGKQGEDKNILPLSSVMHPFLGFRIYCLQEIGNVGFMGLSSFLLSRLFACCICYFGGRHVCVQYIQWLRGY